MASYHHPGVWPGRRGGGQSFPGCPGPSSQRGGLRAGLGRLGPAVGSGGRAARSPPPPGGARLLLVDATQLTVTLYMTGQPPPGLAGGGRPPQAGHAGGGVAHQVQRDMTPVGPSAPALPRAAFACVTGTWKHGAQDPAGNPVAIIGKEPYVSLGRPLRPGSTGPAVVRLQGRLAQFGFAPGLRRRALPELYRASRAGVAVGLRATRYRYELRRHPLPAGPEVKAIAGVKAVIGLGAAAPSVLEGLSRPLTREARPPYALVEWGHPL